MIAVTMTPVRKLIACVATVAGLQTAALTWMITDRMSILRNGREIVLPIVPVDPRSLFRGDYVVLSYPISSAPVRLLEGAAPARNAVFFVTVLQKPDGTWEPERMTARHPGKVADGRVVLAARTRWGWPRLGQQTGGGVQPNARVDLVYGIERYYVPEGQGLELERMVGQKKLAAAIAVDVKGRAAIKGLAIDGKKVYDEPLL